MGMWGKITGEDDEGGGGLVNKGVRAGVGSMGGFYGAAAGAVGSKPIQSTIAKTMGTDRSTQKDLADESSRASAEELGHYGELNKKRKEAEEKYVSDYEARVNEYLGKSNAYGTNWLDTVKRNQAESLEQARSAKATYSNDIQPRLKSSMEDAQREAGYAMSLKDAGDPNNAVHKAVRGMYDQQAQGVQKQGVADYGVLSALGAQATQNVMGSGGPMTGAQFQLAQANNQRQAGEAYARAQQRMDALKQQGIERGFEESDRQYQRGEGARDRYRQSIGDYEGGMDRDIERQSRFRDADIGYGERRVGIERGMAKEALDARNSVAAARLGYQDKGFNRDMSQIDAQYGNQQAAIANRIAEANAENAAKAGVLGGVIQAGATGAGAYYGGAQGAQTGNMIGGSVAQGMGGYQQPPQQQTGFQQRRRNYEMVA